MWDKWLPLPGPLGKAWALTPEVRYDGHIMAPPIMIITLWFCGYVMIEVRILGWIQDGGAHVPKPEVTSYRWAIQVWLIRQIKGLTPKVESDGTIGFSVTQDPMLPHGPVKMVICGVWEQEWRSYETFCVWCPPSCFFFGRWEMLQYAC